MIFYYNSRDLNCKKPFGAVACGKKIYFKVQAKDGIFVENIYLVLTKDGEDDCYYQMNYTGTENNNSVFELQVTISDIGLYWYKFQTNTELGSFVFGKGENGELLQNGEPYSLTIYSNEGFTPHTQNGGVIYQIFADRFNKGVDKACHFNKDGVLKEWNEEVTIIDSDGVFRANDFYGGNLQGIIDKLDYLKALGVTMIYMSPIFKSSSNHRYDTGDYMCIDELLGDESSLARLIAAAKEKGIGIMLDGVFNHTGSDSKYFNKLGKYDSFGAYQGIKSPYYDWYYFINYPDEYACWWGITVTPTVNKNNENYRKFILGENGVLDKWTKLGLAGWRLDVVDELDIEFVNDIRKRVKSVDKNAYIIGEVWEDASTKIAYSQRRPYLQGNQLDGVMNYPFKNAIVDYIWNKDNNIFINNIMNIYENYPLCVLNSCMNFLGTHDTVRAINTMCDYDIANTTKSDRLNIRLPKDVKDRAKARLKLATAILYSLPGLPTIFYGDEVGLEGYEDPINRRPFPWDNMDEDLLAHYKSLGKIRSKYKKAFGGTMDIKQQDGLLHIIRKGVDNTQNIQFIFNNTDVDKLFVAKNCVNCVTNKPLNDTVTLKTGEFLVIIPKNV